MNRQCPVHLCTLVSKYVVLSTLMATPYNVLWFEEQCWWFYFVILLCRKFWLYIWNLHIKFQVCHNLVLLGSPEHVGLGGGFNSHPGRDPTRSEASSSSSEESISSRASIRSLLSYSHEYELSLETHVFWNFTIAVYVAQPEEDIYFCARKITSEKCIKIFVKFATFLAEPGSHHRSLNRHHLQAGGL